MSLRQRSHPRTWSRRASTLAQSATPRWAAACAAAALAAFLVPAAILLTGALYWPGAEIVRILASMFVGPLSLTLSATVLSYQSGRLSAPEALFTAVAAVPAWGLAATAAISWSAGFTAADTGTPLNWFEAATLPILGFALIAGTAAAFPTVSSLRSPHRSPASRTAQSLLLAAPAALALLITFMVGWLFAPIAAAVLLFVSLRAAAEQQPAADHRKPGVLFPDGVPPVFQQEQPVQTATPQQHRPVVAVIGGLTLLLGLLCVVFALTGSNWSNLAEDSTAAMNLGLAAGALNAVPVTVAAGIVLQLRLGRVIRWMVLLVSGGLLAEAAAQFAGVGHPWQWPLTLTGGVLLGFGLTLPLARLLPGGPLLRFGVTAGAGLAAAFIGIIAVAAAGFIAPAASAALLAWCFPGFRDAGVLGNRFRQRT